MKSEPVEIIETYWNVNEGLYPFFPDFELEIIETYWNVNTKQSCILSWC